MVDIFYSKYFHGEETIMLAILQSTKQRSGEDFLEFIRIFRDIVLDCHDHYKEKTLVEVCIGDMIMEYCAILKNLDIV